MVLHPSVPKLLHCEVEAQWTVLFSSRTCQLGCQSDLQGVHVRLGNHTLILVFIVSPTVPHTVQEKKPVTLIIITIIIIIFSLIVPPPCPTGKEDPGPPYRPQQERKRTYKTKKETAEKKPVTAVLVGVLLLIAVAVPMLQFYGYTSKD